MIEIIYDVALIEKIETKNCLKVLKIFIPNKIFRTFPVFF